MRIGVALGEAGYRGAASIARADKGGTGLGTHIESLLLCLLVACLLVACLLACFGCSPGCENGTPSLHTAKREKPPAECDWCDVTNGQAGNQEEEKKMQR